MSIAKVTRIVQETPSTISIHLKPESGQDFLPGQFITIHSDVNGEALKRSYSFSSSPGDHEWRITIKRVGGGKMSNHLHDTLQVGDQINYDGPEGIFTFDKNNQYDQHILIAAGSGITPIMSMMKEHLGQTSQPITLFYGNRNLKETIFLKELNQWHNDHDHFNFRLFLSKPGLKQLLFSSKQPYFKGRISTDHLLGWLKDQTWNPKSTAFYLCGPGQMNEDIRLILLGAGVPEENIKQEYFSSLSKDESIVGQSQVSFTQDGVQNTVSIHKGQAILDGLLEAGYDPPYSCTSGTCCTCMAHVSEGSVKMERCDALSNREQKQGFILTCQARPVSEKVILSYDLDD